MASEANRADPDGRKAPTERSAIELAQAIRRRELSAAEVVRAHVARLSAFQPQTNAIAADRFAAALAEAEQADRTVRSAQATDALPPLLGVPFTVKESIALTDMPQSTGVLARRAVRATDTAPVVARLIDAGAIPLAVTNTSELTLWIESDNPLYGRTSTPYDPRRAAGGSSGGEAAAVGSGGSPFGIGSDIAGSIRLPALFCGVFGHKPSARLVPNTGSWPPANGDAGLLLGTGPLARRAGDLAPVLALIAGPDGIDPFTCSSAIGDPEAVQIADLTVTVAEGTTWWPLTGEQRDARERAAGALQALGAQTRRVGLTSWRGALLPFLATLRAGSGTDGRATIRLLEDSGEPAVSWTSVLRNAAGHTLPTRLALAGELLPDPGDAPAQRRLLRRGREIAEELVAAIGDGVLLHPVHPRPAPRHHGTYGRLWALTPAAVFNLAGVPVTEVPLGLSRNGLPLGVQVAGAPGRDDVTIAVALALERVFGGWRAPPPPSEIRSGR